MPFPRYPSGSCPCQVSLPFELRHFPAGSLFPLSRIEFVSYRLVVLLRLLPTPPHDDAVAVEYGPENVCPVGTFTLLFKCAYERTRRRPLAANKIERLLAAASLRPGRAGCLSGTARYTASISTTRPPPGRATPRPQDPAPHCNRCASAGSSTSCTAFPRRPSPRLGSFSLLLCPRH